MSSDSLFWMLSHWPVIEPTTITSSAPNRTFTPRRWNFGSWPLTSGPMNRPAASHAVAIQKMPSLHVPGAGHAVGQDFESLMP